VGNHNSPGTLVRLVKSAELDAINYSFGNLFLYIQFLSYVFLSIEITMKQPTNQQERNEDKKTPEKENPSHGIDPESKGPEMEVDQDPGERQKENQNQQKDDPLAA
jgi:hypothetical protein